VQTRRLTILLASLPLLMALGCKARVPIIDAPWADDFERAEVGPTWLDTSEGSAYRIVGGKLVAARAYNHPLWLQRRLPSNVVIEFDVMSKSPAGDIKVEMFGDGKSYDPDKGRYDPTSYLIIFGGWGNSSSVIGRLGEHDDAVKAAKMRGQQDPPHVQPGRTYHFKITRKNGNIDWQIDGTPFLSYADPAPLAGADHEYFAINDWEAELVFDNLRIRPAE
jgi:hypothetical protein